MIIKMETVEGNPKLRKLIEPLPYIHFDGSVKEIPKGFIWNGSSVPILLLVMLNAVGMFAMLMQPALWIALAVVFITFIIAVLPRHYHPIASCIHDFQCALTNNSSERRQADINYFCNVLKTSCEDLPIWRQWAHYTIVFISAVVGFIGVRIGAIFKIGSNY